MHFPIFQVCWYLNVTVYLLLCHYCFTMVTMSLDSRFLFYADPIRMFEIMKNPPTWSPWAWRPMTIGLVHPGTRRGTFWQIIGSRNTVPPRMFLIVPLGLSHIFFSLNSNKIHIKFDKSFFLVNSPTNIYFIFLFIKNNKFCYE